MVGSKTRVWTGGLGEIMREAGRQPGEIAPADAIEASDGVPLSSGAQPRGPLAPASAGATIIGHVFDLTPLQDGEEMPNGAKFAHLRSTRVVPIESLLKAPASAVPPERSAPRAKPERDDGERVELPFHRLRIDGTLVRRGLIGVLALAVALLRFGGSKGEALVAQAREVAGAPTAQETSAPVQETPAAQAAEPPATQPAAVARPASTPWRQRQAVDALASGDLAKAHRIYSQLAQTVEGRSVYSEAARILDERLRNKSF